MSITKMKNLPIICCHNCNTKITLVCNKESTCDCDKTSVFNYRDEMFDKVLSVYTIEVMIQISYRGEDLGAWLYNYFPERKLTLIYDFNDDNDNTRLKLKPQDISNYSKEQLTKLIKQNLSAQILK